MVHDELWVPLLPGEVQLDRSVWEKWDNSIVFVLTSPKPPEVTVKQPKPWIAMNQKPKWLGRK